MRVSRSAFLKLCATAFVGIGANAGSPLRGLVLDAATAGSAAPRATPRFDWAIASAALFRPHVATAFTARRSDGHSTTLTLDRVIERGSSGGFDQFSLVFRGTGAEAVHGTYTVQHAALGELQVFIAPVGAVRDGGTCEACFSLPRQRSNRA